MHATALGFIEDALSRLEAAVHDHASGLRNVQLATVSAAGAPEVRTLVLRGFTRLPGKAELHTDIRTAKARAVADVQGVALLAWSSAEQLQLRLAGPARLHCGDAVARQRWEKLSANARGAYGTVSAPGTATDDPEHRPLLPPDEQFRQFGVLLVDLETVDVLRLAPGGRQTRAAGCFAVGGLQAEWVAA